MTASEDTKSLEKAAGVAAPAPAPAAAAEFKDSTLQRVVDAIIVIGLTVWLVFAWGNHPDTIAFPAFLYFCIIAKILTKRISNDTLTKPFAVVFGTIFKPFEAVSPLIKAALFGALTLAIAVVSIIIIPDSDRGTKLERARSLLGLIVILGLLYGTSKHRSAVNFRLVSVGILAQFILGLIVLKTWIGKTVFSFVAHIVAEFLDLGKIYGLGFLWADGPKYSIFLTTVLPAVVFFASFIQVVYYLGAMQWLLIKFAWVMVRLMDTSGSESVVAAASPFVGQGESALLVQPFLEFMTESEIHSIMTSGFSTISGSVLSAFTGLFKIDATSIITSCVMSVPCSLALSKLRIPETENSITKGEVSIPVEEHREANVLHAAANGAAQGMHLAGLITGSLLAIISLFNLCNIICMEFFRYLNPTEPISIGLILSYVFWPFAWILGTPTSECLKVGRLLGTKMVVNEFAAYADLSALLGNAPSPDAPAPPRQLSARGELIAIYALCGFANIGSVGIQIGCLGAMAPSRRGDIARLAVSAMIVGTMCTFCSASIAGILA
ncbi:hypothetical protein H9P43_007976 [Blastocladiella emersonii ATCC 22665]|nr:hypothetical protein H9P43_007976 [Blastocladiella emersonii ATCC 22665]